MHRIAISAMVMWVGITGSVMAHNPLDHPDWCTENSRLVIVDEFEWDGRDLVEETRSRGDDDTCQASASRGVGTRTCGQFDDDWGVANGLAANHCADFRVHFVGATHPDHGTVVHIAEGPEAFVHEDDHHERYRARMGLRAHCVRCEPLEAAPTEPER